MAAEVVDGGDGWRRRGGGWWTVVADRRQLSDAQPALLVSCLINALIVTGVVMVMIDGGGSTIF